MANVVLPVSLWLTLGGTFNILNYDDLRHRQSIFKDTDVLTRQEGVLNFTYYVLEEDELPYSDMRLPIDLVHKTKTKRYQTSEISYDVPNIVTDGPIYDRLVLLVIAEYTTAVTSIRKTAAPVPKWKELVPSKSTHYAAEQAFGSRCVGKIEIRTGVPGDTQVVRRIFEDVMEESGTETTDFLRLWKKAIHEARRDPDVRGRVRMDEFKVKCKNAEIPREDARSFRKTIKHLMHLEKLTPAYTNGEHQDPIWVSFEPLHSLDEQYPELKKNKASEETLISLDEKLNDLRKVIDNEYKVPKGFTDEQMLEKKNFWKKVEEIRIMLYRLADRENSIYKDLDGEKFSEAFERYSQGLHAGAKNYFTEWKKIHERREVVCGMKFQRPTTGILKVRHEEEAENSFMKAGSLKKCKQNCRHDENCRAIQFDENDPRHCFVYYVSTNTADIEHHEDQSVKIYDRKCKSLQTGQTWG